MKATKKKTSLLAAREASGKTQRQVAQEAKINERVYRNYEYDENELRIRTAIRIADEPTVDAVGKGADHSHLL